MRDQPLLSARGLTRFYGTGCVSCRENTGPAAATNRCSACGTIVACAEVSFDLYPDETIGIVGESGSGKSTVVRLLHFDIEPSAGSLSVTIPHGAGRQSGNGQVHVQHLLDGTADVFGATAFERRMIRNTFMGIVYQNAAAGLRMQVSAGGNVAERLIAGGWSSVGAMRDRAAWLLDKTEIPLERMDELPRNFSGGMQQRVQIAKALSNSPVVLLLDEVTTGLDLSVQARVLDVIRSLQREFRLALIVVSHDLGVIRLLTSRTMVMKHGRVIETGLTDQILEDPQHPYTQLLVSSQL